MSVFELEVLRTGRRRRPQGRVYWEPKPFYTLSEEATDAVDLILERYGQSSLFYFNNIVPEVPRLLPWAFVCLDREYPIAGHLVTARPAGAKTRFTTYTPLRGTAAKDHVPPVATLIVASKDELESLAACSPVFQAAWCSLALCDAGRFWLSILDPLPEAWVATTAIGDDERFLAHVRQESLVVSS